MSLLKLDAVHLSYPKVDRYQLHLKNRWFKRGVHPPRSQMIKGLQGVSLDFDQGKCWGIIGHNGAGKSSLLKVCAGVYPPSSGLVHRHGQVQAMFNPALGFNPHLSGYENITFKGLLMGFSLSEIKRCTEKVIDFAEFPDQIHHPLRTYSTGMKTRLALAMSIHADADILLFDEIFGSLDEGFLGKLSQVFDQVLEKKGLLIIASHSSELIRRFCSYTIWMKNGQVHSLGLTEEIIAQYLQEEQIQKR